MRATLFWIVAVFAIGGLAGARFAANPATQPMPTAPKWCHLAVELWRPGDAVYTVEFDGDAPRLLGVEGYASAGPNASWRADDGGVRQTLGWVHVVGLEDTPGPRLTAPKDPSATVLLDRHLFAVNMKATTVGAHVLIRHDYRDRPIPLPQKKLHFVVMNRTFLPAPDRRSWAEAREPYNGTDAEFHLTFWYE
jgi:hypothetical protein